MLLEVLAWSNICVRFARAFWIDVLDERFVGAGKSGPIKGQDLKAWARGNAPKNGSMEKSLYFMLRIWL